MQQAAPVALIAVAVAGGAALGATEGFCKKLVRYRAALLMAVTGIPVTGFGVLVAHMLSQPVLLALFACVMLVSTLSFQDFRQLAVAQWIRRLLTDAHQNNGDRKLHSFGNQHRLSCRA